MKTLTWDKTRDMEVAFSTYRRLVKIATSLHHLDEVDCNYGLNKRQETRQSNLMKKAEELANVIGLHAYHQGDPRGCSLYLVRDLETAQRTHNYNSTGDGIAIY